MPTNTLINLVTKYLPEVSILFSKNAITNKDNRSFKLPVNSILKLSVAKNYRETLHPILFLEIAISERDYYYILDKKNDVKIMINLKSYLVEDEISLESYLSRKTPYMSNTIFNGVFRPYFEDVTPFSDKKATMGEEAKTVMQEEKSEGKRMAMYLFLEENLEKNKIELNYILKNATVFESIVYACNKTKINNLIIELPHNGQRFRQIICPPTKFRPCLDYLQENYGIYRTGVICFEDFDRTYILPKVLKRAVTEREECKYIYILVNEKQGTNINMALNSYYDKKKYSYYINTLDNLTVLDNSVFDKEIEGDAINVMNISKENIGEDVSKQNVSLNAYKASVENTKSFISYNDNQYLVDEYKSELMNRQITLNFPLVNIDVSFITPNKEIILIFENGEQNSKFGGHYSLKNFSYTISRATGGSNDMQVTCELELNKVMYV